MPRTAKPKTSRHRGKATIPRGLTRQILEGCKEAIDRHSAAAPEPAPVARRPSRPEVVRVALARRGWSQRELAISLGVSPQRLNQVLSGKVKATDDWWARAAIALEVPFVDLGLTRADVTRPAAELELVRYAPGRSPTTLVPWGDEAEALAARLGLLTPIGPGDLLSLVKHLEAARVSLRIRLDQPPLA